MEKSIFAIKVKIRRNRSGCIEFTILKDFSYLLKRKNKACLHSREFGGIYLS